jgi:hypothetical protein
MKDIIADARDISARQMREREKYELLHERNIFL